MADWISGLPSLATSIREDCDFFVTADEKHLLRAVCREAFEKHIRILNPNQALELA